MTKLEKLVASYSQKYYTDGSSEISDSEFDKLLDKVRDENPDSEVLTSVGHGYDVSIDNTYGEKVIHEYGLVGSLPKCRTYKEIGSTLQNTKVDVSLKLDGISVVLYYKDGNMLKAVTRGDGTTGINITDKVKFILKDKQNILHLNEPFTGAIRGEILMKYSDFSRYEELHEDAKNPRNTTAGLINQKELSEDLNYLTILFYTIMGQTSDMNIPTGHCQDMREHIKYMLGSENVVPYVSNVTFDEQTFLQDMDTFKDRWYNDIPADGLVLTNESITYNVSENRFNYEYDAKAFKFKSETADSEVTKVIWNMSKTRYAVPKVQIKPVSIAGTTVEFCTGYNAKYILDNQIGPGSIVTVQKHGEIIPNIDEVKKSTYPDMIYQCPCCGNSLSWNGVHLQCKNGDCSNGVEQDTKIWISKLCPTDGLGDILTMKMLQNLVYNDLLEDISVESIMESDLKLPNDTDSAQANIFANMWSTLHNNEVSCKSALEALNIPRLGEITSKKLSSNKSLVGQLMQISRMKIDGMECELDPLTFSQLVECVGNATANSISENMWKFKRINFLKNRIVFEDAKDLVRVAVTGKLSISRSNFAKELLEYGYQVADFTNDTKLLITDDPSSSSSKNKKADKLNIPKISESEFRKIYLKQ